jgi:hypothetical protein
MHSCGKRWVMLIIRARVINATPIRCWELLHPLAIVASKWYYTTQICPFQGINTTVFISSAKGPGLSKLCCETPRNL